MATILKDEEGWKAIEFHDWTEFLTYAERPVDEVHKARCPAGDYRSWTRGGEEFFGVGSFEEASKLAREGWDAGIDRMRKFRADLDHVVKAVAHAKAQSIRFDLSGEWLDVGRYVQGDPECFGGYDYTGEDKSTKVVSVTINIACSGSIGEASIFARGAVCLAAVDVIEACGHRVELKVGSCAKGYDGRFEYQVVAKRPGDALDVDRLTFFLCHKSGPRRYGFACYEHQGRAHSGIPTKMLGVDDNTVYVPELVSDKDLDTRTLRREVMAMCEKAGITFDEETLRSIVGR